MHEGPRVRILIATCQRNLVGGVEKYLQTVIPALLDRGHSIGLLYEYPFDSSQEKIEAGSESFSAWCLGELGAAAALRSIDNWEPDAVYSHGLDDSRFESALLERYPMILYAHTYYGTCVSGRKCYASPRLEPCSRTLGAGCLLRYYPRRCGGLDPKTMWQLFQWQTKRKASLPRYQAVLVASEHMREEYARHGVDATRLHLAPLPGVDCAPGASPPAPRKPGGRVLFVGRLMDVKGAHLAIEALPKASQRLGCDLSLTIAGDGPDRAKLETLARRLEVNILFVGWVGAAEKFSLMRKADLVAVPSIWPEPFGLVGIEAGSCGVPAVGFQVGGVPDWLISGQTGELAPGNPPTAAGLADAMVRALSGADHYNRLAVGAWEMARRFSIERHLRHLESILTAAHAPASIGAADDLVPRA